MNALTVIVSICKIIVSKNVAFFAIYFYQWLKVQYRHQDKDRACWNLMRRFLNYRFHFQHNRWPHVSFAEAHGYRDPIRSIQQKENIENMARLVTACFGLYTEEQCLVSLFDSDYFWSWNKKKSFQSQHLFKWSNFDRLCWLRRRFRHLSVDYNLSFH